MNLPGQLNAIRQLQPLVQLAEAQCPGGIPVLLIALETCQFNYSYLVRQ